MNSIIQLPRRPRSLREVSAEVLHGAPYPSSLKEFVDVLCKAAVPPVTPHGFYSIDVSFYQDEPHPLADPVHRAHLAGIAETLAMISGMPKPAWCEREDYTLSEPTYAGGRRSREALIATTPSAFRNRLLFCGPALEKLFRTRPRPAA